MISDGKQNPMPIVVDLRQATSRLDLEQRLRDLPATAMVRGIFFRLLKDETQKRGLASVDELRKLLDRRDVWRLYPARELMSAYATAASLIDPDPNEGLRTLFHDMAPSYGGTWYGQLFRKFLGTPDPARALRYIERAKERVSNYSTWRLETVGPRHVVLHMFDEYFWIESAQRGGCEGLLRACDVQGTVRAELDSPYAGALDIQWTPRPTAST
jgi:uncharacterized protein (TIGR02265 family)